MRPLLRMLCALALFAPSAALAQTYTPRQILIQGTPSLVAINLPSAKHYPHTHLLSP